MTMQPEEALRGTFGFSAFREGQRAVVDALLGGKSALAVFPTGAGKSLCYQLPAVLLDGLTVVVSPLIALMKDQIDFLTRVGVPAARLDSSLGADEYRSVTSRLVQGELKLLYVAPERFNNERFLALLEKTKIALFAVDEAHCISEWGHNFRPDYLKLATTARACRAERVLALTATATPGVVKDICAGFAIAETEAVVTGFYRPNLTLLTTPTRASERDDLLAARLRERPAGPTLVYVTLQKTAERVAKALAERGFPARAYHAGMDADDRAHVQDWWQTEDAAIVVATIAFGMGIDKANVRYVYHYNLPKSLESYMQEVGRAGRDGAAATLELFASRADLPVLENFAYGDTPSEATLATLVRALMNGPRSFDVNLIALSNEHDIRPLVLRTALTYLELCGALRQGTPFYAGYEARPLVDVTESARRPGAHDVEAMARAFDERRATFVRGIFANAKRGRVWYQIDPDEVASALATDRERVVRALEYLEERRFIELRAADARMRFERLAGGEEAEALIADLMARFARREELAVAQVADVVRVVDLEACQTNALVAHFGQERAAPCGHCTSCLRGGGRPRSEEDLGPPIDALVDRVAVVNLAREKPRALGEPRQLARFLCGLSSPALTAAKLTRHALCGALEGQRFRDVLNWCASLRTPGREGLLQDGPRLHPLK
jgi:ATP-dependent DNA helicase RecQ